VIAHTDLADIPADLIDDTAEIDLLVWVKGEFDVEHGVDFAGCYP
jgi:hypothetical protein